MSMVPYFVTVIPITLGIIGIARHPEISTEKSDQIFSVLLNDIMKNGGTIEYLYAKEDGAAVVGDVHAECC